jgi:hypothetical protein
VDASSSSTEALATDESAVLPFRTAQQVASNDIYNTDTWFKADQYQNWYWAGCASWLLVDDVDKTVLLFDAYVSKATAGGDLFGSYTSFAADDVEARKRVARYVNLLRWLVLRGYSISGILTSHEHADHVGDLKYILQGLRLRESSDFMNTGIALTGKGYTGPLIRIVMSGETNSSGAYMNANYGACAEPSTESIYLPSFGGTTSIRSQPLRQGTQFRVGPFEVVPYIWGHGNLGGEDGKIRTMSYNVRRANGTNNAWTFVAGGYIERASDALALLKGSMRIACHNAILGRTNVLPLSPITDVSDQAITFLANPPAGSNYLLATHTDNNDNATISADEQKNRVTELYNLIGQPPPPPFPPPPPWTDEGKLLPYAASPNVSSWGNVNLKYFAKRLGVDDLGAPVNLTARDIDIGANGSVHVVGPSDGRVSKWAGTSWYKYVPDSAVKVAVEPGGTPWVITSTGAIQRYNGSQWVAMPGTAQDIDIGANGSVHIIGTETPQGRIYNWTGSSWSMYPCGAALKVAVDPSGIPWVVTSSGSIHRWDGGQWIQMPGTARDIDIGANGSVHIIGTETPQGRIYKWTGSTWSMYSTGAAMSIAVDPSGTPWVITSSNSVHQWDGQVWVRWTW